MFDLIVVGAGSAGLTAASVAQQLGARVALIEKERTGGDCTWTGCVPSKTFIKIASVAHQIRSADRYGLDSTAAPVDLGRVMAKVRSVVEAVYDTESPDVLRDEGIEVVLGGAKFVDASTLEVAGSTYAAKAILLCTGAHPFAPPIAGLSEVDHLTYETVWQMHTLPERLLIVGAGPIGAEMAQAFARLGSRVTVVARSQRLLVRDEPEASAAIAQVFEAEGISLMLGRSVDRIDRDGDGVVAKVGGQTVHADQVLVSVGRRPNVAGLGLDVAGIAHTDRGISVDDQLRTSVRTVFACGDCIGREQFTHYAGWQGAIAARNALMPGTSKGIRAQIPWTTFTDPEVAHAGLTEADARARGPVESFTWPMSKVDRARTDGATAGFVKVVFTPTGRVLGTTVVAPRAGEMIQEWIIAIDNGLSLGDLLQSIHVYPTYSTANQQLAARVRLDQLLGGRTGDVIRGIGRLLR